MIVDIPIANGYYKSESLPISAQECVNYYPVIQSAPSRFQENLFGTPGLLEVAHAGMIKRYARGAHEMDGVPYFVIGGNLFRMDSDYSLTNLGVITGTVRVSMADNGSQLMVLVPGGDGYILDKATQVLSEITDADFRANGDPQFCAFVDGYFVATTDEKKFIVSGLNDGMAWDALDFGSAEADPDSVVAPIVYANQLFITGTVTIEAFQNIGGVGFPFQRSGLYIQRGVSAPYSLIGIQDTFMFIGGGSNESPAVWALAGNGVQKISTQPIDYLLHLLTEDQLQEVFAWAYADKGAYFVGFALPDTCIVYDISSGRWHERKSYIDSALTQYRVGAIVTAYNQTFASDLNSGKIGELCDTCYTEFGQPIIRSVVPQPFTNQQISFSVPALELVCEAGVGNADCANPKVTMQRSLDGKTWTDPREKFIGAMGKYGKRTIWKRNGRASQFELFRFTVSDPVKPVLIGLVADVIGGIK